MIISEIAVKKSIAVLVLTALIVVMGIYSYLSLPRENDPDVTIPHIFVSTSYSGVSPEDVETAITIELENKLKGLDGLKELSSISSLGSSLINAEFVTGTDIDEALRKVKDKVDEALGELPADLEDEPVVFEVNLAEMPILVFSLSGVCGLNCLKRIADDLEDKIEQITGVLEVEVTGGREREIRVEVLPEKLAYYGVAINSLEHIVRSENRNISGGIIHLGDGRFQLRVPGEFATPQEIYELVLTTHNGEPVYLRDVAVVRDAFKKETSRSRSNSLQAVKISVKKRYGENILAITREVEKIISNEQKTWPRDTTITRVLDKSRDIKIMVADLENNILSGLVLVVIVVLFSMGFRNALLISLAIPFSMFISFSVLQLMGVTLNIVVLFSLTLAMGMLVDNSVVIMENIYRFMEQGMGRVEAAMKATAEVSPPVIVATLITVAAFLPLLFWPGIIGEYMGYLPLTLIITLSSSLFVALVINPALASLFLKNIRDDNDNDINGFETNGSPAVMGPVKIRGGVLRFYRKFMDFSLSHPLATITGTVFVLIFMVQGWLLVVGLERPVEFFPEIEPRGMFINLEVPEGADLDYIDHIARQVEMAVAGHKWDHEKPLAEEYARALVAQEQHSEDGKIFVGPSDLKNIEIIYTQVTTDSGGGALFALHAPNYVGVRFLDLEDRFRSTHDTVDDIRERVKDIAGAKITIAVEEGGPPTGPPINIEIAGEDFSVLGAIAREIKTELAKLPHVKDISDNFIEGSPTIKVNIDRQRAALFGLTTDMIGSALKTAYNGIQVSTFREGGNDYDITIQLSEENRETVAVLHELMLMTPSGVMVPLSTLTEIEFASSIGEIHRINSERVVTVAANVDEDKIPGAVVRAQAEKLLSDMELPPDYMITFTGEDQEQRESEEFLGKAFLIAMGLIFLILVTQFNSMSQPFIIMTSVLLSLGGAFLGLMIYQKSFGIIMTGVGVISLAGVVVRNAIVLVDYINKLRQRKMVLKEAVISGGATRLRPVILTAVTTVVGLIPMVTGVSFDFRNLQISWVSESSQWWSSMAVVVIFGLIVATFLTLVVVPTLYYLLEQIRENLRNGKDWLNKKRWDMYPVLSGERCKISRASYSIKISSSAKTNKQDK